MNTAALIEAVNQGFMEATGDFHSNDSVVNALNEAYDHIYRLMLTYDHDGQFFGEEDTFTYPAGARSVVIPGTLLRWQPLKIHAIEQRCGATRWSAIPVTTRRREGSGKGGVIVTRGRLFLISPHGGGPPTTNTAMRVYYTPEPIHMVTTGNVVIRDATVVTWNLYEPELGGVSYGSLVSYAIAILGRNEDRPTREFDTRYDQIERDVMRAASMGLVNTDAPEIEIYEPDDYSMYGD